MGPSAHREERLDSILSTKLNSKWNEETEAKYLESVRNRAVTKVRAMLLQAKRRSDEIIAQAEVEAKNVHQKAENAYADLLKAQKKAQVEYEKSFELASQNANEIMRNQLLQDQMKLGESTAVVLLSIHQQLQNIYDAWREELRLLTLEAIQVGTGWVADSKREEILSSMLDECVRKLIDKKEYTVRVHPSDGALVTQVLENSREKSWSMETNSDLDPGSLEVEDKHAIVKNSSKERKIFVQDILENLLLPATESDDIAMQSVTNTLMHEMQSNPLLAQTSDTEEYNDPNAGQNDFTENNLTNTANNTASERANDVASGRENDTELEQNPQNIPSDYFQENTPQNMEDNQSQNYLENTSPEAQQNDAEFSNANDYSSDYGNDSDNNNGNAYPEEETAPAVNPNEEAESLVDEFLTDFVDEEKPQSNGFELPSDDSQDVAQSSTDTQQKNQKSLPQDVADDLLAEMGF